MENKGKKRKMRDIVESRGNTRDMAVLECKKEKQYDKKNDNRIIYVF